MQLRFFFHLQRTNTWYIPHEFIKKIVHNVKIFASLYKIPFFICTFYHVTFHYSWIPRFKADYYAQTCTMHTASANFRSASSLIHRISFSSIAFDAIIIIFILASLAMYSFYLHSYTPSRFSSNVECMARVDAFLSVGAIFHNSNINCGWRAARGERRTWRYHDNILLAWKCAIKWSCTYCA